MPNIDQLAEDAAFEMLRNVSDADLSDMLGEVASQGSKSRDFLALLVGVRKGYYVPIGEALHQCLFQAAMRRIDTKALSRQAEENAGEGK